MSGNTSPLVCVCVPTFNSEATITGTLRSILTQTYKNIKVIVVDNASSDNTLKIIGEFARDDGRLEVVRNPENIGAENNFTRCIQLSCGEYTAIYHADDLYEPGIIEEEVLFLERNRAAGAVFTASLEIDSAGKAAGRRLIPPELADVNGRSFAFDEIFKAVLRNGNFLTFPSALVRTDIYKKEILAWNGEKYRTSADLDVWLRIAERHEIGLIDKQLIKYRISTSSFSYGYSRLRTARQDLFLVLEDYFLKYAGRISRRSVDDYHLLMLKDDISVAINHIIRGERLKALPLLRQVFRLENIAHSFRSLIQLKFLLIGYAAFCAALLPLGEKGRNVLARVRHKG